MKGIVAIGIRLSYRESVLSPWHTTEPIVAVFPDAYEEEFEAGQLITLRTDEYGEPLVFVEIYRDFVAYAPEEG